MSACQHEAFGIATAEMIKSGAIVWVPSDGGQTEIVSHPLLTYRDDNNAVEKIIHVLKNNRVQSDLRQHLDIQNKKFSKELFMRESINTIDKFLKAP